MAEKGLSVGMAFWGDAGRPGGGAARRPLSRRPLPCCYGIAADFRGNPTTPQSRQTRKPFIPDVRGVRRFAPQVGQSSNSWSSHSCGRVTGEPWPSMGESRSYVDSSRGARAVPPRRVHRHGHAGRGSPPAALLGRVPILRMRRRAHRATTTARCRRRRAAASRARGFRKARSGSHAWNAGCSPHRYEPARRFTAFLRPMEPERGNGRDEVPQGGRTPLPRPESALPLRRWLNIVSRCT